MAHERYVSHFGPLHQRVVIANHTFVMIDAPGLVEEDEERAIAGMSFQRWASSKPGGPIAFIQESAASQSSSPVALKQFNMFTVSTAQGSQPPCLSYY